MAETQTEAQNRTMELLSRAVKADMEAFCLLVAQQESRLLGQAFALCGNQAIAEELAQQTWVEAWKSLARFDIPAASPRGCMAFCCIAITASCVRGNLVPFPLLSCREASQMKPNRNFCPGLQKVPTRVKFSIKKNVPRSGCALLESLPQIHREVVLLRYFEEASLEEIATVTGPSRGNG